MTHPVHPGVRPASAGTIAAPPPSAPSAVGRRLYWIAAPVLAVATFLARLPLSTRPLSPDEAGFLMVAAQWHPGSSLYGDYWVDRPPMLLILFRLADLLGGGPVSLRLLGASFVAASVLLAAAVARTAGRLVDHSLPRSGMAPVAAAATVSAFLVSPLFGATEVDGELLAVPFVLAGILAALEGATGSGRRPHLWWAVSGALAVAATAVKQDMVEVFVVAVVLLVASVRRHSALVTARSAAAFAAGVVGSGAALLAWAAWHGTWPAGLWDAIVSFRLEASAVIAASAPDTTHTRALGVAGAFLGSGAIGLVVAALAPAGRRGEARRPSLLVVLTAAVLAWEVVAVSAGGSYWLHYLVGTVPGLVLASATAAYSGRWRRLVLGPVLGWAAVVAAGGVTTVALAPIGTPGPDLAVERYLSAHERPGDTGVVAFGDPALLQAAHLSSPYPELWSLPVRVRDPGLSELTRVLSGPQRPTWVVVDGDSVATWGVDPTRAEPVLDRDYHVVQVFGDWHVYHLRVPRTRASVSGA